MPTVRHVASGPEPDAPQKRDTNLFDTLKFIAKDGTKKTAEEIGKFLGHEHPSIAHDRGLKRVTSLIKAGLIGIERFEDDPERKPVYYIEDRGRLAIEQNAVPASTGMENGVVSAEETKREKVEQKEAR